MHSLMKKLIFILMSKKKQKNNSKFIYRAVSHKIQKVDCMKQLQFILISEEKSL